MYSSAVSSGSESRDLPVASLLPNQLSGGPSVSPAAKSGQFDDILQTQVSSYNDEVAEQESEDVLQAEEQQFDSILSELVEKPLVEGEIVAIDLEDKPAAQPLVIAPLLDGVVSSSLPQQAQSFPVEGASSLPPLSEVSGVNVSVFSTLRGEVDNALLQQPQPSLQALPASPNSTTQNEYSGPILTSMAATAEGGLAQNSQFDGSGGKGGFQQLLSRLSKDLNEEAVRAEIEEEDGYRSIADQSVSRRSSEVSPLASGVAGRPILQADEWLKVANRQLQFMFKNGVSSVNFKLTPENLGELDIQIVQEKGVTQVWFGTTDPQVKELIENSFSKLRSSLDSEVEGDLNLFTRDGEDGSEPQEKRSTFGQSFSEGVDAELEPTELRLDLSSLHRIDTFI